MLRKIRDSEQFKTDYKKFRDDIREITDPKLQAELTELLVKLVNEVDWLDECHDQLFVTGKMPSNIEDSRSNLISYRKNLENKITSWKNRQKRTV